MSSRHVYCPHYPHDILLIEYLICQERITLINNVSNRHYEPILEFLHDGTLEILASDDDQANTRYNRIYCCFVDLRSSTWNRPWIPESLLPTLPAPTLSNSMPGDRKMDIIDTWIVSLGKMKVSSSHLANPRRTPAKFDLDQRAYLSDQINQNRVHDIIDAYADTPSQSSEQGEISRSEMSIATILD